MGTCNHEYRHDLNNSTSITVVSRNKDCLTDLPERLKLLIEHGGGIKSVRVSSALESASTACISIENLSGSKLLHTASCKRNTANIANAIALLSRVQTYENH